MQNDIELDASSFSIISLINEFSDVTIDVLNESKRTMFISNDVVLDCCRKI